MSHFARPGAVDPALAYRDYQRQRQMTLGDLLLATGQTPAAAEAYGKVVLPAPQQRQTQLRYALCDWVEGRFFDAVGELRRLGVGGDGDPLVRYYAAAMLEQLGQYEQARTAIRGAATTEEQLGKLILRLQARLAAH